MGAAGRVCRAAYVRSNPSLSSAGLSGSVDEPSADEYAELAALRTVHATATRQLPVCYSAYAYRVNYFSVAAVAVVGHTVLVV